MNFLDPEMQESFSNEIISDIYLFIYLFASQWFDFKSKFHFMPILVGGYVYIFDI